MQKKAPTHSIGNRAARIDTPRGWFTAFCLLLIILGSSLSQRAPAQQYGLDTPSPIGSYLNEVFPHQSPSSNTSFTVEVAFPSLTITGHMFLTPWPNSNYLAVVQKTGKIVRFENRANVTNADVQTVLDISGQTFTVSDSGMTGLVFHPEFGQAGSPNRGYIYVTYKWRPALSGPADYAYIRLSRFTILDGQTTANPGSEQILLQQFDRQEFHDAGCLMFGLDGYLYFSIGDEGGGNDEYDVAQRINERLMSGIFRIDVDKIASRSDPIRRQPFHHPDTPAGWPESFTANYYVPKSNPFVNPDGSVLEEFYVLGCRQPYRFSQDRQTGEIWLGESGQSTREEINILQPGSNYQWPYREGTVAGPKAPPATIIGTPRGPLFDYGRDQGGCIIGGYVYRGTEHAVQLTGKYVFVDNVSGRIFAVTATNGVLGSVDYLTSMPSGSVYGGTSSCGLDANGEIYFLKFGDVGANKIYKLAKAGTPVPEPPALLSQTGAFSNLATLTPAPGLIPYDVNTPLWSDGAAKQRWMAAANNGTFDTATEKVVFHADSEWQFPSGTVFVKHFELPIDDTNPNIKRRLETRFLVIDQNGGSYGVTYKWRADGSDADLLATGASQDYTIATSGGGTRTQTWSFPSRLDCTTCHNANARNVLGLKTHQLNGNLTYPSTGRTDNQLRTLGHLGLFDSSYQEADIPSYLKSRSIHDESASLEIRARSYFDANCSQCHRPGGVRALFDARFTTPLEQQGLIHGPVNDTINGPEDRVIRPQDRVHSLTHNRASRVGFLQMPPIAKNVVDADAMAVLGSWIDSLAPGPGVSLTQANPAALLPANEFQINITLTDPLGLVIADMFVITGGSVKSLTGSGTNYVLTVRADGNDPVTVQFRPGTGANANYVSNLVTVGGTGIGPISTLLPFDEGAGLTAEDASGNGNQGALRNMTQSNWVPGKFNTGLSFDGVNDYVEIENRTALDFTLACWVKTTQIFQRVDPTYAGTGIIWSDVGGAAADFILGATRSTGGINRLSFFSGGGVDTSVNGVTPINTGDWVHIAATRNGTTGEMKIYVNGALDASAIGGTGLLHANPKIEIGGNTLDGRYLNGLIDDVRIFDRVLTATELGDLLPTAVPRVILTAQPYATGKFQVRAEFSRPVTGFTASDIQITNGTLSALSGSGSSYRFSIDPTALGDVAINIPANRVLSAANVGNSASSILIVRAVTITPTVSGLAGYWPFDNTAGGIAPDLSGAANNGSLTNMGAGTILPGRFGGALDFDGVDDYVLFNNNIGDNFSISLWVRTTQNFPQTDTVKSGTGLFWSDSAASSRDIVLAGTSAANGLNRISLFTGGQTGSASIHGVTNIPAGEWVHIAAVRDRVAGTTKIYVNGALDASATGVGTAILNGSTDFRLGGNTDTGAYFRGQVDEFRVYNRALTPDEVGSLASAGNYPSLTLVGRWRFDETAGLLASDSSGAVNPGALQGMTGNEWTLGRIGGSLALDGTDDSVLMKNPIGDSYSVSCWVLTNSVFPSTATASSGAGLWWSDTFGQASDFGLAVARSGGVNRLTFGSPNPSLSILGSQEISTGEWVHLAATRDRTSGEIRTYVNGLLEGVGVGGRSSFALNPEFRVGAGSLFRFPGLVDDLRLYSGVLSAADVAALALGANPGEDSYAAWVARVMPGRPVAETARTADPDGDGYDNEFEFVYAMDPNSPEGSPFRVGGSDETGRQLTFRRRIDVGDISYRVFVSPDLVNWSPADDDIDFESVSRSPGTDYEEVTVRFHSSDPSLRDQAFFRMQSTPLL